MFYAFHHLLNYSSLDCLLIYPEFFLIISFLLLLIDNITQKISTKNLILQIIFIYFITILFYIVLFFKIENSTYGFFFSYKLSHFLLVIKIFILLIVSVFFSYDYYNNNTHSRSNEYIFLTYIVIVSNLILLSSNDFLLLYVCLELYALSTYVLINEQKKNIEITLNYFIVSTLASVFFLLSVAYIYGFTSLTNFSQLNLFLSIPFIEQNSYSQGLNISFALLICSLFIKLGIAPFHFWIINVYSNLTDRTFFLLSLIPKITLFFIILNLTLIFGTTTAHNISYIYIVIALSCFLIGSFLALEQVLVKNFLVCSSIVNSGYILINFSDINLLSSVSFVFYLGIYIFTMFLILCILYNTHIFSNKHTSLSYLYEFNFFPVTIKIYLSILILSLIGLPPFGGFFAKLFLLETLFVNKQYLCILLVQLLNIVGGYYYIYVILFCFFSKPISLPLSIETKCRNFDGFCFYNIILFTLILTFYFFYAEFIEIIISDLVYQNFVN
jgi:NADH-quinone oxidoreductase subunit N